MNPALRVASWFLVAAAVSPAQAPAGYRTVRDEYSGLEYFAPADYLEIPLPPTEMVLRGQYRRKTVPDEIATGSRESMIKRNPAYAEGLLPRVVVFAFTKKTDAKRGYAGEATPEVPLGEVSNLRELQEQRSQVDNFDEFLEERLAQYVATPVNGKGGHYELSQQNAKKVAIGYLILNEEGNEVSGVYGVTVEEAFERIRRTVTVMAGSLKPLDAADAATLQRAIDQIYTTSKLRGIDARKRARATLARGWKAADTPNYIIVHRSPDEGLINKIARDIEAMREVYEKLFPPARPVEAVSVVRVCRNRGEFMAYGGPPTAGGYWSAGNEELVFYDYEQSKKDSASVKAQGARGSDKDSLLVLYHEALHQYLYYAVGEISPHDWFNEGHGDYFSGAFIPGQSTKVVEIRPSRWRVDIAKKQMSGPKPTIGLEQLLRAERNEYYNPAKIRDFYAAGWSLVYFLRTSPKVKAHPEWSKLIDRYFDTLKGTYAEGLKKEGDAPSLEAKMRLQQAARTAAIEALMNGLTIPPLEAEWQAFIRTVKSN